MCFQRSNSDIRNGYVFWDPGWSLRHGSRPWRPLFFASLRSRINLTGAVQDTENTCLFDLLYIEEQKRFPAQLGWRFWIQVVRSNLDIGLWMQLWVSDSGSRPGDPSFLRPWRMNFTKLMLNMKKSRLRRGVTDQVCSMKTKIIFYKVKFMDLGQRP